MSISRRGALTSILSVGAAGGLTNCAQNTPTAVSKKPTIPPLPVAPTSLLLNHGRAKDILAAEKVDLLICANPINIYYLTNQRPLTFALGMNDYAYATLSSAPTEPPTYIASRYEFYLGGVADTAISELLNINLFSAPADPEIFENLTDIQDIINAKGAHGWYPRLHADHEQANHEKIRRAKDAPRLDELYANSEAALLKQLFATDLTHKTIAIDHPKLRATIAKSGLDVRIVDGERLLRRIRLQKSPAELELARYAITANVSAARAMAATARAGATLQDLRREFSTTCGQHMSKSKYVVIDGIVPDLAFSEIKEGRSFLIDCVSEFEGYHGDFGRTVCVGEPSREMQSVIEALSHVWDRILPQLKPGVKYSDIYGMGAALFAETNIDVGFAVNPHCIGLNHTDEPSKNEFGLWVKEDIMLEENMILSVDLPLLDTGLGGTAHLEDLVLIGKDGPELLNTSDDRFIVV